MEHTKPYIDRILRIFISYSSHDKVLAGKIKVALDMYGFDTFLAHEDIDLGVEWEKQIIRELKSCDIFIPILSDSFKESDWASQEIGIVIELQKKILPLNLGINPYGFIRGIQAIRVNDQNIPTITEEIISHLKEDEKYGKDLVDTIIRGFVNSNSFDSANTRAKFLKKFNIFNENQATEIARGYLVNNQISGGFGSKTIAEQIIKDNKNKIATEILNEIEL
jgi:hypothetical protein